MTLSPCRIGAICHVCGRGESRFFVVYKPAVFLTKRLGGLAQGPGIIGLNYDYTIFMEKLSSFEILTETR